VIGGFYIGERYCILHALSNKKGNLAVFNLADFCNSPNHQNKFYTKFLSYMVSATAQFMKISSMNISVLTKFQLIHKNNFSCK